MLWSLWHSGTVEQFYIFIIVKSKYIYLLCGLLLNMLISPFFHLTCRVLFVLNFNIIIENKGFNVKLTERI